MKSKEKDILEKQIKLGTSLILLSSSFAITFWIIFHSPLTTLAMISVMLYGIALVLITRRIKKYL